MDPLLKHIDTTYHDIMVTLKYCRNQLAAVNPLPNSRVFLLSYPKSQIRKWMRQYLFLTSVCRPWRNLALKLVQLWASIDLSCNHIAWKAGNDFSVKKKRKAAVQGDHSQWKLPCTSKIFLANLISPQKRLKIFEIHQCLEVIGNLTFLAKFPEKNCTNILYSIIWKIFWNVLG